MSDSTAHGGEAKAGEATAGGPACWSLSATRIAAAVRSHEISAVEVVRQHFQRIGKRDQEIRAIALPMEDDALQFAQVIDDRLAAGEDVGPLAGVPLTIKECFDVAGHPTTLGLTTVDGVADEDAPLVAAIRRAGGIVIGKSNVPQMMMLYETVNPLYGRTVHPLDAERVVGGSSGGEAAAIAANFSALGLGTDLGGSIRVPAAFCGICGFKPTSHRLTRRGTARNFRGMDAFIFQPGPMARHVGDLRLLMQSLSGSSSDDWEVPPVETDWRRQDLPGLRIGCLQEDSFFPRHPAIHRALEKASRQLEAAGAEVVAVASPIPMQQWFECYIRLLAADGGWDIRQLVRGSRLTPQLRTMLLGGRIPNLARPILSAVLRAAGSPDEADFLKVARRTSASGYWRLVDRLQQMISEFHAAWSAAGIDAWLAPACRLPAFRHGQALDVLPAMVDVVLPNLLGAPAGVVPITTVGENEQIDRRGQPRKRRRLFAEVDRGAAGLPIGIQVAALRWRDPVVLDVMEALEESA